MSLPLNPIFHHRVECRNMPYTSDWDADYYVNDLDSARLLANSMKAAAAVVFFPQQLKDRKDTYKVFQVSPGSCREREMYSA